MKRIALGLAAALAGCGLHQLPSAASAPSISQSSVAPASYANHKTYRYVGKEQSFRVPANVRNIYIIAIGGRGGGATASFGSRVSAVLPVSGGEVLQIRVGGNGAQTDGGYNGGGKGGFYGFSNDKHNGYGGGGATDIREYGGLLADRILVAGGGGGQGGLDDYKGSPEYGVGGKGGNLVGGIGAAGYPAYKTTECAQYPACGGRGGSQRSAGAGGLGGEGNYCNGATGRKGSLGTGGNGAKMRASSDSGECGGLGGGGGAGYYGGGGGGGGASDGSNNAGGGGGGGGGSSYVERRATNVHMWQGWRQNEYGLVVVHW